MEGKCCPTILQKSLQPQRERGLNKASAGFDSSLQIDIISFTLKTALYAEGPRLFVIERQCIDFYLFML